jgi:hypothetical protein
VEGGGRGVILRYHPHICLKGLKKTTINLSQDSRCPGQDLNPGPSEYEPGMLTLDHDARWMPAITPLTQINYEALPYAIFCSTSYFLPDVKILFSCFKISSVCVLILKRETSFTLIQNKK